MAAGAQASGAILSRAALADTEISPLLGAMLRLSSGVGVLILYGLIRQQLMFWLKSCLSSRAFLGILVASLLGTYLGIWLQQISLKYAAAGIAQTLAATSPLFVLPIAIGMGERVSSRAILGAAIAIGGITLLINS